MRTTILEVGGLLSVLGALGIDKQLRRLDGVSGASVNIVSGTVAVIVPSGVPA